jgi:hypothetical protein
MSRKEEIFLFIQSFYRHVMNEENNILLEFNINKDYKKD